MVLNTQPIKLQFKNKIMRILPFIFLCIHIGLFGQSDFEKKLQTKLILAEDGDLIEIEAGEYFLKKSLSLDGKKNIIIRGKGMDKTILNFENQTQGAEGIKITNCENIVLSDLTTQNSKGDLIKTMHVKGMSFLRVKTEWTGKPSPKNGSYGLYPVLCEKVLIDSCIAIGASDAGIYVGQSKNIIVRNCTAFQNVAGIEIENSLYAEVYNNTAMGNTGGILVFDLPDLIQKKGGYVRVHHNLIKENNLSNFAPKGNIVGNVPKGTGMMVLATSNVDIFDNKIINHSTMGIAIISYFMTENKIKDKAYYPYPTLINVHDNVFERKAGRVPMEGRFGMMYRFKLKFGRHVPDVIYDGILDKTLVGNDGQYKPEYAICVRNNSSQKVAILDAENDFKNIKIGSDLFNCTNESIKSTEF